MPEVLVPLAADRFDTDGNLVDEETRGDVRDLVRALAAWTRRVANAPEERVAS